MPALPELQSLFFDSFARRPGTVTAAPALLACVAGDRTMDAAARLQVYADAYWLRLREVLVEDFPRTAAALAPEVFDEVARDYLAACPSRHPSLRHLGDAFPSFVAARDDVPAWLGDLARLEMARADVFDSADDEALDADDLRGIAPDLWPSLCLGSIRALRILELEWSVHELWKDDAPAPQPGRFVVRVWRDRDLRVLHAPLAERPAAALRRLVGREPFSALCTAFEGLAPDEAGREIASLLSRWVEDGILAAPLGY